MTSPSKAKPVVHQFDLTSQAFKRDPHSTLAAMREAGPMIRVKLPLIGVCWVATTYESAGAVLKRKDLFLLDPSAIGKSRLPGILAWLPRSFKVLTKNMLTSDEPDHRRLRSLVEEAFLRHSVDELQPDIERLADRFLDEFEAAANANGGEADLLKHFCRDFPLAVICELLGLPDEDRPKFSKWAERITSSTSIAGMLLALPGLWGMFGYLREQFRQCRNQPRPGMISALVEAEHEGRKLSEDELLAMTFLLLFAGHETTTHLISTGLLTLLQHEDQKQKLMADWSKAPAAVDEILRFASTIQMTKPRYPKEDIEFFGQQIEKGEMAIAFLASANTDPAAFENPETLDIDRAPNKHLGFGSGIHICLGLKLARAEVATAFEKLFTRYPNLELATSVPDLKWNARIGVRNLLTLPLQLNNATN